MQLGITVPLQRFLKIKKPPYGAPMDLFFCWELHGIILQGKRTLILVNASNGFTIIMRDMSTRDWEQFSKKAIVGIRRGLLDEEYSVKQIERYFELAGNTAVITKTHGRRSVASLNRKIEVLMTYNAVFNSGRQYQSFHSQSLNRELNKVGGHDGNGRAVDFFVQDMKRFGMV